MTIPNELTTLRDYIRYAITKFNGAALYFGHGTDNALDEAYALCFHTLNLPHHLDMNILDAHLLAEEKQKLYKLINDRVQKRIPLPYLTNEAWFAGLPFYVDERVLIPRSPLAETIESQFQPWLGDVDVNRILDLCTGSGCIAVACAQAFPSATIDASDISEEALAVAKMNVLRHGHADQIQLIKSNLFDDIPNQKYDVIISNPPYVSLAEIEALPKEYEYEPKIGLQAGVYGLDVVLKILRHAEPYLTKDGILVVEVGNSEHILSERYPDIPFTWLTFERGGGGVFLLTAGQLRHALPYLKELT